MLIRNEDAARMRRLRIPSAIAKKGRNSNLCKCGLQRVASFARVSGHDNADAEGNPQDLMHDLEGTWSKRCEESIFLWTKYKYIG